METQNKSTGTGIGMIIFLIFMVLKLTKTIDWSWWWITSPLWIPLVIISCVIFIGIVVALFKLYLKK